MHDISDQAFDKLISELMDELPQEYIRGLENVAIVYADAPSPTQAEQAGLRHGNILLGLYEGIPLPKRGAGYTFVLPDKITLFKHPLMQVSETPEDFREHVKRTLWHEIAHYYGLDHDQIHHLEAH